MKLKKCPCGKTPPELDIFYAGRKWANCAGSCCNEWMIEFQTDYYNIESPECMKRAEQAWNNTIRAKELNNDKAD